MTATRRHSRRAVLGLGMLAPPLLLAACTEPTASRQRAADQPVLLETWASEMALIAAYEAAVVLRPELATTFAAIAEQHRQHATTIATDITVRSPSVSPTASPSAAPTVNPADVIGSLRDQERAAAAARAAAAVRATGGPLAALLCLIGASEAQHVAELGSVQ